MRQLTIMFSFLTLLCLPLFQARVLAQTSASGDKPITDKWALIVGISEFPDTDFQAKLVKSSSGSGLLVSSHTNSLQYTVKDACDMRNFLIEKAGFKPDHIKLLLNSDATHDKIEYLLGEGWLERVARPDDLVVLFVSSHGSEPVKVDSDGARVGAKDKGTINNYIVTYDFDRADPDGTGLSMQRLGQLVKQSIRSKRVVVFVDTCFSGAVKTRGVSGAPDPIGFGQIAVTSCSAYESSMDDPFLQNGLFTSYLLSALEKNKGQLKPALAEMQTAVTTRARMLSHEQHPTANYSRWTGGDVSLFAKPTNPVQ